MQVHAARLPLCAAGLAMIAVAAVTGCAASSSSAVRGVASAAPPVTPATAVKLAAQVTGKVNSFTATMSQRITVKPGTTSSTGPAGNVQLTMTLAEQLHPALLASATIGSYGLGGTSLPGGITEVITPTALYMKWSYLTKQLHLTKPWLVVSLSSLSKSSGINFSQLLNQATGNGPLTQSQVLAGATSVRQVGAGSIDGVPVTEYTGTVPLNKGLSFLSGSIKAQVQQLITAGGLTTEHFTVWIDGMHLPRKLTVTAAGKSMTETTDMTITSINQPVSIAVPSASQTSTLPASDLG
jgi:hypothetical protein